MGSACSDLCLHQDHAEGQFVSGNDGGHDDEFEQLKKQVAAMETAFEEQKLQYEQERADGVTTSVNGGGSHVQTSDGRTSYKGYMKDGKKHGFGAFCYTPSGDVSYEGEWSNNKINGVGKFKDANGSYLGQFEDQSKFRGYYSKGKKEGNGIYIFGDGTLYEGQFKSGEIYGKGKLTDENGIYLGQFVDSVQHGTGRWEYKNGDVYEGHFVEGERHGEGRMSWGGQDKEYVGQWNDGVPHGRGKIRIGEKTRDAFYIDGKPCTSQALADYEQGGGKAGG